MSEKTEKTAAKEEVFAEFRVVSDDETMLTQDKDEAMSSYQQEVARYKELDEPFHVKLQEKSTRTGNRWRTIEERKRKD